MRSHPPHPFVRFRIVLLVAAIAAWVIAFTVLALFKGSTSFPVAVVVAIAAIIFVWSNGAFWWLELRYPHLQLSSGQYASRAELSSGFMQAYSGIFFGTYGIAAFIVTIACLQVAAGA